MATGTFNKNEKEVKDAIWSLSDPGVGTLSVEKGTKVTFTASAVGTSKLYAEVGTVKGEATIEVYFPVLTRITVTGNVVIENEDEAFYYAVGYDQYGTVIEIDPATLTWSQELEDLGTLSPTSGALTTKLTAVAGDFENKVGKIVASVGTISGKIDVVVIPINVVDHIIIDPPSSTVDSGGTYTYTVIAYNDVDENEDNELDVSGFDITWGADAEIGSIDVDGVLTAVETTEDLTGKVYASITINGVEYTAEGDVTVEAPTEE